MKLRHSLILPIVTLSSLSLLLSSFSAQTLSATCPMDLNYVPRIPWNSSVCHNHIPSQDYTERDPCCKTVWAVFNIALAQRLKDTSLFMLPNLPTSISCLQDFQSKLTSLSLPSDIVSRCIDPMQTVITRNMCAGIESTQDVVAKLGDVTDLSYCSRPDLTDLPACNACVNAGFRAEAELLPLARNSTNDTECSHFLLLYSAGIVNRFGLMTDGSLSCIIGLSLTRGIDSSNYPGATDGKKHIKKIIIVAVIIGITIFAVCIFFLWKCTAKCKEIRKQGKGMLLINRPRSRPIFSSGNDVGEKINVVKLQDLPLFSIQDLAIATNSFHLQNKLGDGGFGPVYKGVLQNGQKIAVKRLSRASGQGLDEFMNEVLVVSKLQHRNLVRLLGCCVEKEENLLVYEYMPNSSLDTFLFGRKDSAVPESLSKPLAAPISSGLEVQHHVHHSLSAASRPASVGESFVYGSQGIDATADLSDQPLDFVPRFNGSHDQMQTNYNAHPESVGVARSIEPLAAMPSMNLWTPPVAAGVLYPPISSVPVSATQHDPSLAISSPGFGHTAPPFARFPAPVLQPAVPSTGASFGLGTGTPLHPVAAFSGDIYGSVSERPKKAPVPNWLKEELFKSSALPKPSLDNLKELQQVEDDGADKSFSKGDQADSKSIDSSKSTEEEDDQDYVEAARTAAINQEIKRILTEVLLKVTDELFDEIATKVINEDDMVAEVDPASSNHKTLQLAPASTNSGASARVVVPKKDTGSETVNVGEKSSSSSPGNVLGLANYDSDDDEDNEFQSSSVAVSGKDVVVEPPSSARHTVDKGDAEKIANSQVKQDRIGGTEENLATNPDQLKSSKTMIPLESRDDRAGVVSDYRYSSKVVNRDDRTANHVKLQDKGGKVSRSDSSAVEEDSRILDNRISKGSVTHDSHGKDSKMETEKNDKQESRSFSNRDSVRREGEKREEDDQKLDEKHLKRETTNVARKEKLRERGVWSGEIAKESEPRRKADHPDPMEERKDKDRSHRASTKDEPDRKKDSKKTGDRSIHKHGSESGRQKRQRSSSVSSRGRISKDNSGTQANDSNDEVSNDSRSKINSRKRDLSPSPDRSRRRQVSRSPRSKHYQRRHSPYSSHETARGRRSRSRSPVRRTR